MVKKRPVDKRIIGKGRPAPSLSVFKALNEIARLRDDAVVEGVGALAKGLGMEVWLVGGVVRNIALGMERPPDYDFAVSGDPNAIAIASARRLGGSCFVLDKDAPSYRVAFKKGGAASGVSLDFSPLKGKGVLDDLKARDFTVDAMAVDVSALFAGEDAGVLDPCGGVEDAKARVLRAASPGVFDEDPLRMLRAVRLSRQYGLEITADTSSLIRAKAGLIGRSSVERVRDELLAIFSNEGASVGIRMLYETGLMRVIIPEMGDWDAPTGYDVLSHTLKTLDEAEALLDAVTEASFGGYHLQIKRRMDASAGAVSGKAFFKLAAFFHDVGKPSVMTSEDGRLRFRGHDHVGSLMTKEILRRLRFSRTTAGDVAKLVGNHHRVFGLVDLARPTARAKAHLLRSAGPGLGIDLLLLALADARATRGGEDEALLNAVRGMIAFHYEVYTRKRPKPVLTGTEIMKTFRIPEGPLVGEAMAWIAEGVESGAVKTKKDAVAFVRERLMERQKERQGR
ncbi:MAG: HD domain-containing protein [Deltaproteobacteria bacterium]|nr:HD domain-containing protein [Deltaproteobacteria bacterium]